MWNSPRRSSRKGKRYEFLDLAALVHPLDQVLDALESNKVSDLVHERILANMESDEFVFAIFEVFQALLENHPVPKEGHAGYHEAIVAELIQQTRISIDCELTEPDLGESARKAAWVSLSRLCKCKDDSAKEVLLQLEGLPIDQSDPAAYRSPQITAELWDDLLLGDAGLWDEFLWDDDWRQDGLLDLPEPSAKKVTAMMGIDLDVVHCIPHAPTTAERQMAEHYLRYISWKYETHFSCDAD